MTTAGARLPLRQRRFRLLVLALVLAVGAVGAVVWMSDDGGLHDKSAGPLYTNSDTRNSIPVGIGEPFTFGEAIVNNKTDKTAVLEAVRTRPALPDGMEIVDILVVGPNRKTIGISTQQAWPPPDLVGHLRPLKGAVVPPESTDAGRAGVEIVFGLKATKPGVFGFAQFDLDYRIGSTKYTVRLEDGFMACAPYADFPDGCDHAYFDELDQQVD